MTVGEGAEVREDIETVNGDVTLRSGVRVGGSVSNVNGDMLLEGATVGGGLETVNADIRLTTGSRCRGRDSHREDQRQRPLLVPQGPARTRASRSSRAPSSRARCVFEREVDLYVAPGVELPAVQGVQPKRFTLQ